MYEIYAVIGVVLIITGVSSSIYFILQIKKSKFKKCFIERLSDGLGTLFLGIFYIYCYTVLCEKKENVATTLYFPDMEETYLNVSNEESINSDIFSMVPIINTKPAIFHNTSTLGILIETDTNHAEVDNEYSTTETVTSEVTSSSSFKNKNELEILNTNITESPPYIGILNDTFNFYQNYFKDILRLKTENNSKFENWTIFFNNTEYIGLKNKTKLRTRREATRIVDQIFINANEQCFRILFLKHSLLICSFLYSIICLINNTKLCYTDESRKKLKPEELNENLKQNNESKTPVENSSEPSGELFIVNCIAEEENEITAKVTVEKEPNLDIFLAKNYKSTDLTENIREQSSKRLQSFKNHNILSLVIKLLVIWILPGLCIYSLHMMMETKHPISFPSTPDVQHNFNTTRANNEMMELLNRSFNVTTHGKTEEINDIVKSVYNIVGRATEYSKTKSNSMNKVIYDIVDFMNNKFHKGGEINKEDCFFNTISLKLHSFILFFLMYFASIFYSKILQLKMKQEKNEYTNLINLYIIMFTIIWLPGILELFTRIYVFNEKPSTAAGCTLSLGNLFIVFNNLNNYALDRNVTKIRVNTKI